MNILIQKFWELRSINCSRSITYPRKTGNKSLTATNTCRAWFEKRLDDAIKAAEDENNNAIKKVDGSEEVAAPASNGTGKEKN